MRNLKHILLLGLLLAVVPISSSQAWIWSTRPEYRIGWGYVPPFGLGFDWKYPYVYGPAPGEREQALSEADQYCMERFRSYDPATRTYLGYDGHRHPCP